jgi:hypothetical protein
MNPIQDSYGQILKPGARVAFNYSGNVRLGKLLTVKPVKHYGKAHNYTGEPFLKFEVEHQGTNMTSTITSRHNLVVIPE